MGMTSTPAAFTASLNVFLLTESPRCQGRSCTQFALSYPRATVNCIVFRNVFIITGFDNLFKVTLKLSVGNPQKSS